MKEQRIKLPEDIAAGCRVALREHLQREPTQDEVSKGLAEMVCDVINGVEGGPKAYAKWLARVLEEDVTQ